MSNLKACFWQFIYCGKRNFQKHVLGLTQIQLNQIEFERLILGRALISN